MKALLLAAGFGSRLKPITEKIPKCLVEIQGRPLLDFWIKDLISSGVDEILINTHYKHELVNNFIQNHENKNKVKLTYETQLLGTAKTLINNIPFFRGEGGLLIHADNLCLSNLNRFYQNHYNRPINSLFTMMTFISENPSSCGIVEVDDKGIIQNFFEKVHKPPSKIANGAIYFLSKEFLNILKKMKNVNDFSLDIIPKFIGKIYTSKADGILIDIGTVETYNKAKSYFN